MTLFPNSQYEVGYRDAAELRHLNREQRAQIWKQVDYHLNGPPSETLALGDGKSLSFSIDRDVTRPMSSLSMARWLWNHPREVSGRRILDIGTGCGIQGVVAALRGAKQCDMLDVVPEAVQCAKINVAAQKVDALCSVFQSDLFDQVPAGSRYDRVLFAQPLFGDNPIAQYKFTIGMLDPGILISRFFLNAAQYLSVGGRVILLGWDFAGRINDPRVVGQKHGWTVERAVHIPALGCIQQGQFELVVLRPKS